jgi:hypothetical protein
MRISIEGGVGPRCNVLRQRLQARRSQPEPVDTGRVVVVGRVGAVRQCETMAIASLIDTQHCMISTFLHKHQKRLALGISGTDRGALPLSSPDGIVACPGTPTPTATRHASTQVKSSTGSDKKNSTRAPLSSPLMHAAVKRHEPARRRGPGSVGGGCEGRGRSPRQRRS